MLRRDLRTVSRYGFGPKLGISTGNSTAWSGWTWKGLSHTKYKLNRRGPYCRYVQRALMRGDSSTSLLISSKDPSETVRH